MTGPKFHPGVVVLYEPSPGHRFLGVVASEPWSLGDGTEVAHLERMEAGYATFTGRPAGTATVKAAALSRLTVVAELPASEPRPIRGGCAMSRYLIQDTRPNDLYPGMCVWWAPDRKGYVTDLNRAGRYSEDEARSQERDRPTDRAVPEHAAVALAVSCVDSGQLRSVLDCIAAARTRVDAGGAR